MAGRTARPANGVYTATKWGISGWSESLRQELQPDVRVTVIEPGAVGTELTDHITHAGAKQATEQFVKDVAIPTAEDIAFAVARPRRMTLNEILIRPTAQADDTEARMQITRNSIETATGPGDWFTGTVYIDAVATPAEPSRLEAASVHFTPGARTAWHTHPFGQTI